MKKAICFLVRLESYVKYALVLLLFGFNVFVTCASAFFVIRNTQDTEWWRKLFFLVIAGAVVCILLKLFESAAVRLGKARDYDLKEKIKAEKGGLLRKIQKYVWMLETPCILLTVFNLFYANVVCDGIAYRLSGTWQYDAGRMPVIVSFLVMVAVGLKGWDVKRDLY